MEIFNMFGVVGTIILVIGLWIFVKMCDDVLKDNQSDN